MMHFTRPSISPPCPSLPERRRPFPASLARPPARPRAVARPALCLGALGLCLLSLTACSLKPKPLRVFDLTDPNPRLRGDRDASWEFAAAAKGSPELQRQSVAAPEYRKALNLQLKSAEAPDIFYAWPAGPLADASVLSACKDLGPVLGDYLDNVLPALRRNAGGGLAILPLSVECTHILYANQGLLRQQGLSLPQDYAQLVALSAALRRRGITPIAIGASDSWVMQTCLFSTILGRFAGPDFVPAALAGRKSWQGPESLSALRAFRGLFADGVLGRELFLMSYDQAPLAFAQAKAAFLIDAAWNQRQLVGDQNGKPALIPPQSQRDDIAVGQFPPLPGERYPGLVSILPSGGYAISASIKPGSARERAAVRALKAFYDSQSSLSLDPGTVYSRIDQGRSAKSALAQKTMDYAAKIGQAGPVLDALLPSSLRLILENGLRELALGRISPESLAADMAAEQSRILQAK